MQGPFEIDVKVRIAAGENTGIVTYSLPVGMFPTRKSVEAAIAAALAGAKESLGDEVRLLTHPEMQHEILSERHGVTERFACSDEWDT